MKVFIKKKNEICILLEMISWYFGFGSVIVLL